MGSRKGRLFIAAVTAVLVLIVVLEAGVLYKMVSVVVRGESPRQLQESPAAGVLDRAEERSDSTEEAEEAEALEAADEGSDGEGERLLESGDIGEYHIEIGELKRAKDADGKPVAIVTYSWTNNSEATASAMVMLMERAYQGGTRLTSAQVAEGGGYDGESASRTVPAGGIGTVQRAFLLAEEGSDLTFEVSEFLSHTKDAVVKEFDLSGS